MFLEGRHFSIACGVEGMRSRSVRWRQNQQISLWWFISCYFSSSTSKRTTWLLSSGSCSQQTLARLWVQVSAPASS